MRIGGLSHRGFIHPSGCTVHDLVETTDFEELSQVSHDMFGSGTCLRAAQSGGSGGSHTMSNKSSLGAGVNAEVPDEAGGDKLQDQLYNKESRDGGGTYTWKFIYGSMFDVCFEGREAGQLELGNHSSPLHV